MDNLMFMRIIDATTDSVIQKLEKRLEKLLDWNYNLKYNNIKDLLINEDMNIYIHEYLEHMSDNIFPKSIKKKIWDDYVCFIIEKVYIKHGLKKDYTKNFIDRVYSYSNQEIYDIVDEIIKIFEEKNIIEMYLDSVKSSSTYYDDGLCDELLYKAYEDLHIQELLRIHFKLEKNTLNKDIDIRYEIYKQIKIKYIK